LDPQPWRYVFFENNSTDETLRLLSEFECPHEIIRMWFVEDFERRLRHLWGGIALARHFLLKRARQLDPDFAVFLDADHVLQQSNALEMLTSRRKDLVSGLYVRWQPYGPYGPGGADAVPMVAGEDGLDELLEMGLGCACLSRRVIQDRRLDFSPYGRQMAEDIAFTWEALNLGYRMFMDTRVTCEHVRSTVSRPWERALRERIWRERPGSSEPRRI